MDKIGYRFFLSLVSPTRGNSTRGLYFLLKLAVFAIVFVLTIDLIAIRHTSVGEWGDFFGGVLNPILTFITFMGLLITIVIQQTELRESRIEFKRSADALNNQNEGIKKQSFEATFFQMLSIHNTIVNSIDIVKEDGEVTSGRDCFNWFYSRLNKLYRENIKKANGKYSNENVLRVAYELFWKEHQTELGHYYRYLYNVMRFVKESDYSNGLYIKLIRAQLSDQELLLLFYNCVSGFGINFKPIAEEFELLNNMPKIRLLDKRHEKLIDQCAFGRDVCDV